MFTTIFDLDNPLIRGQSQWQITGVWQKTANYINIGYFDKLYIVC